MSLFHTEFIDTNNPCIKHEIDIKEEYLMEKMLLPESGSWNHPADELAKCGDIFISNSDLILACVFCDDRFDTMLAFGEHIRSKHLNSCGARTPRYIDHGAVRTDIDPGPLTKTEHAESFANCSDESRSSLAENSAIHSDTDFSGIRSNKKTLSLEDLDNFCATCKRQYKNRKSFRQHQVRHQNTNPCQEKPTKISKGNSTIRPDLYCNLCNRYFKTKCKFRDHAARHDTIPIALQQDPNYLKCKYCDKQCLDHVEWDDHERTHDGKRPFSCPHCSDCFQTNAERKLHLVLHNGQRPFKCDKCPKAFADSANLKRHIQAHLGVKRYTCEVCTKRFLVKSEKDVHMRTHTGEKPFQCEECGRSFISSSKLTDHRKRHTGIKNFKCEICGSLFYSNIALKEHKVKHSDARPYQCSECGASFPRLKALKAHVKIHSDIKEYVCNICGKQFAQAAGLYVHRKSHGEKLNLK